ENRASTFNEMASLVRRMKQGQIKILFIHGANPLFELPAALGFDKALEKVPTVISFASFPDETALQADYIFPDHTALESWGYQRVAVGADRAVLSASQPVVVPLYDTKATADGLLAAVQHVGGDLTQKVPYTNEVDFLKRKVLKLIGKGGAYDVADPNTFWALFLQHGGWWARKAQPEQPQANGAVLSKPLRVPEPKTMGEDDYTLIVYPSPILAEGAGANRPWLQETPDPMTTVMWNTWVEINPETARQLGVQHNNVVRVISSYGEVEAVVYVYPGIRPDVVAIPLGQGHTALGRFAKDRGANPAQLLTLRSNQVGDLAFASVRVRIEKTEQRRPLARKENVVGVYGDGA
ncbi:MAG TPA: nitrate reductase, partial [Anaerolineales bacterium]|nr:nitrate reductase [Anaerolineales bacterium]